MRVIVSKNVNEAFPMGLFHLRHTGVLTESRGIKVIEFPTPVTNVYTNPTERVLLEPLRDANPFFHFMECLWIMAGRNDVNWISKFNSKIGEYSDDGIKFHGAYGYRLRKHFDFDQIQTLVNLLLAKPDTRQAVLQIWDAAVDLNVRTKDMPCNDLLMFKIRNGNLHMTVCNRSNDIIWGCYGANEVHFSLIQEYVASKVGAKVGNYYQISDSLHAYVDNPQWELLSKNCVPANTFDPYNKWSPYPIVNVEGAFRWECDLDMFFNNPFGGVYANSFFTDVAVPMLNVWDAHKQSRQGLDYINSISATDWRIACKMWLTRRYEKGNK